MRNLVLLGLAALFMVSFFIPTSYAGGTLSCAVNGTGTTLLRISNYTNAHSELPNQSAYSYLLVCRDTGPAALSILTTGTEFLKLANYTNAHVEKVTQNNYNSTAYLGAANGTFSISYRTACKDLEVCIATIPSTSDTDLHVADCTTDPYTTKVCARMDYNAGTTCNADSQCLGGICSGGACVEQTIKVIGKVVYWENSTPVSSATVQSKLLRDNEVLDQKTTTTDSDGDYEVAFDVRGRAGDIYVVNSTITKGDFSTYVTREFLIK